MHHFMDEILAKFFFFQPPNHIILVLSLTTVDSKQHKVTVTGDIESEALIKNLLKNGKQAQLWLKTSVNQDDQINSVNNKTQKLDSKSRDENDNISPNPNQKSGPSVYDDNVSSATQVNAWKKNKKKNQNKNGNVSENVVDKENANATGITPLINYSGAEYGLISYSTVYTSPPSSSYNYATTSSDHQYWRPYHYLPPPPSDPIVGVNDYDDDYDYDYDYESVCSIM